MKLKRFLLFLIDNAIIIGAFLFCIWYKPASLRIYLPNYLYPFLVFGGLWFLISAFAGKYKTLSKISIAVLNKNIIVSNFIVLGTITLIMYTFRYHEMSRFIVFGTVGISTSLEIIIFNLLFYIVNSHEDVKFEDEVLESQQYKIDFHTLSHDELQAGKINIPQRIKNFVINECGEKVFDFLSHHVDLSDPKNLLISTTTSFNIEKQPDQYFNSISNLKKINDIRYLNKFFESVNKILPNGSIFIGCVETKNQRKRRILAKYPTVINRIYYFFDFIVKRVFPKFSLTKRIYFFLTRGENRVLTRAETLGRLYSCGFEVVEEKEVGQVFFFVARKVKEPAFDLNPTYGPFIQLRRVGKNGKIIKVYKFRTMHPYAEYLQDYVYQKNSLDEGGKFKNDFRVSTSGKIMRKLWIDELPMIINLLKGDLKIVGVRPISQHYFNLFPKELQEERIKTRPGLVPPFYADMPKTMDEIVASEMKYLEAYKKHPIATDFKYFFAAFRNIVFKKARSQ